MRIQVALCALTSSAALAQTAPDAVVAGLGGFQRIASVGDQHAYSATTIVCNTGDAPLIWQASTNQHPLFAFNLYRLADGRFEQIGMSWVRHGFFPLQINYCGSCTVPPTSDHLGIGCGTTTSAGLNASHQLLGPRSEVNASTGAFPYPFSDPGVTDSLSKRLIANEADLSVPGALYFLELQLVHPEDSDFVNSAGYRRGVVNLSYNITEVGTTYTETPGIAAWRDHGLGADTPDPDVLLVPLDVAGDGRFWIGAKASDNGDGTWHYQFAVQNLTSDRSGASFSVPVPGSVNVSNITFAGVDHHSGEPYSTDDWDVSTDGGSVTWRVSESFDENVNANALRWGSMFAFGFDADAGPVSGDVSLGLFKPGFPDAAFVTAITPGCLADWNADGLVNSGDFLDFLNDYNLVRTGGEPVYGDPDLSAPFGSINTADFLAFLNVYAQGCS